MDNKDGNKRPPVGSRKKKFCLIVNPISGTRDKSKIIPRVLKRLGDAGYDVTVRYTQGHGDATVMAKEAVKEKYDVVGVCGGDGTVNEAARALCDTGVPMAIIPSGSGNGLARHIGLPVDEELAVDIICEDHVIDADYGEADGEKFFCTFGVGFDAEVAHDFASRGKRGLLTYIRSAISVFIHHKGEEYTITIDDGAPMHKKAFLVTCCNASQYGNDTYISPYASVKDGKLDVVILEQAPALRTLLTGLLMVEGWVNKSNQATTIKAQHVVIERENPGHVHVDGDPADMPDRIDIRCYRGKLRLFTNPHKHKFVPFLTPAKGLVRSLTIKARHLFG